MRARTIIRNDTCRPTRCSKAHFARAISNINKEEIIIAFQRTYLLDRVLLNRHTIYQIYFLAEISVTWSAVLTHRVFLTWLICRILRLATAALLSQLSAARVAIAGNYLVVKPK